MTCRLPAPHVNLTCPLRLPVSLPIKSQRLPSTHPKLLRLTSLPFQATEIALAAVLLFMVAICRLISTVGEPTELPRTTANDAELDGASLDFGRMAVTRPAAVLRPESSNDIAQLVRASYEAPYGFTVSARGHGHSINGQAQAAGGVVVQMSGAAGAARPTVGEMVCGEKYVDVWGGELWIHVLRATLEEGLAPRSWTDYLYLSVGGTLSNAGISGQAFNYGPQISNVYELDVITGRGEEVKCSKEKNSELFYSVLGGLGQFGIITRARIALEPAPSRVKWIRVLYSNFTAFTADQEMLISRHGEPASRRFDYVEGFVIVDEGLINNWRSSFFSPRNPVKISSLGSSNNGGVLYCLEMAKNYDESSKVTVDQEVEGLLKELNFIPATVFSSDLPYLDFLDRVHKSEIKLRAKGLWNVPHPWLNLFVPKSRIEDFDAGVFKGILGNKTSGPILIYPVNKNKWDERSSLITPDEDIFYLVAFLRSALPSADETLSLEYLNKQNQQILSLCNKEKIGVKQYLPHYKSQEEWKEHFGENWERFVRRKMEFDPKGILAPGQGIFQLQTDSTFSRSFSFL